MSESSEYEGLLPDDTESEAVAATAAPSVEESASEVSESQELTVDEEIPPEPGDPGDLTYAPLAVREAAKLAGMSPEQRRRYDAASAEIAANPAVQSLQQSEDLHDIKMATFREEMRKRLKKEKA